MIRTLMEAKRSISAVSYTHLDVYKRQLFGHGQIVGDYASGKKQFHFKDLK